MVSRSHHMPQYIDQLIERDVALCRAMVTEIEDYLRSNVLFWEPNRSLAGGEQLPKLTLGGLLLAMRRLETLRRRLEPSQEKALNQAGDSLIAERSAWPGRYGAKLDRDLQSKLDTWAWYLDDCQQRGESAIAHYPHQVADRVKIDLLLEEADEVGLEAASKRAKLAVMDKWLRTHFQPGDFCWPPALRPGFDSNRFWYLWGEIEPGQINGT